MQKDLTKEEEKLFSEKFKSFFIGVAVGVIFGCILCGLMVSYFF